MFNDYEDFSLRIGRLTDDGYEVIAEGPGGEGQGFLILPTGHPAYQRNLERLNALDTDDASLAEFGQCLFDALFTRPIKDAYIRSQGHLRDGQALRLILKIDYREAEVAAAPWEFLADPDKGPLAMLDAPIVRYLYTQARFPTLAAPLPLKVLLTSADTHPHVLNAHEVSDIKNALEAVFPASLLSLTIDSHLTRSGLQRHLRKGYHVWHFVGHGGIEADRNTGFLLFEDHSGDAERVNARELSILLQGSGVRLVVLNACQSANLRVAPLRSIAPALIRAEVPAVIAMQSSISVEAARAFTMGFYETLGEGLPIDACVTEGRKSVMGVTGLGRPDWGIPVVYTRAPDGRLFAPPAPTSEERHNQTTIEDGFVALRALMDTPQVYAALINSHTQFDIVLQQINRLSHYKRLHDQFQQIEDRVRIVDGDRRQLPHDASVWAVVTKSLEDLNASVDTLLQLSSAQNQETWTKSLIRIQHKMRASIDEKNPALLSQSIKELNNILSFVPLRINGQLNEIARGLQLRLLTQHLSLAAEQLGSVILNEWKARQRDLFVWAINEIGPLAALLDELVKQHDLFQNLENELHLVELELEPDADSLRTNWSHLQPLHQQVCDQPSTPWAYRLIATATDLERSLSDPTSYRPKDVFQRYRSQVSQSFNQVDIDLLKQCEKLQGIGKSLEFVLRTLP